MVQTESPDFVGPQYTLNSATYNEQRARLPKLKNGLFGTVALMGSTHKQARWREDPKFIAGLGGNIALAYNPDVTAMGLRWDPNNANIEAQAMMDAGTVVFRLENNDLRGGSIGSIAEVGYALLEAYRGQKIIISMEDNLAASIPDTDTSAQLQLHVLQQILNKIKHDRPENIILHIGDDYEELGKIISQEMQHQVERPATPLTQEEIDQFVKIRADILADPFSAVVGGSGNSYHPDPLLKINFFSDFRTRMRALLVPIVGEDNYNETQSGIFGELWEKAWGNLSMMKKVARMEMDTKQNADILVLPIFSQADSKAAVSEIPFMLSLALKSGQPVAVLVEPLDVMDFFHVQYKSALEQISDKAVISEAGLGSRVSQVAVLKAVCGFTDEQLGQENDEKISEAHSLINSFVSGETADINYDKVKKSLLARTGLYQRIDNARRVRTLALAHMERIVQDPILKNLVLVYGTDREEFLKELEAKLPKQA